MPFKNKDEIEEIQTKFWDGAEWVEYDSDRTKRQQLYYLREIAIQLKRIADAREIEKQ